MSLLNENLILVVDLEATCWENRKAPSGEPQSSNNMDILEFGCALATRNGELLDSQSFLVQPNRHATLSAFCTSLTGIDQAMVDAAPKYADAVRVLDEWLRERCGQSVDNMIWCSWGNYGRLHILAEGEKYGYSPAFMAFPHLNLKRIWRRTTGQKRKNGMIHALAFHDLPLEGHHHRGVDDARNMVRLLRFMDWTLEPELLTHPETLSHGAEETA